MSVTASVNRKNEWKRCCANAMGFEWVDRFEDEYNNKNNKRNISKHTSGGHHSTSTTGPILQVISLLDTTVDPDFVEVDHYRNDMSLQSKDAWMETVLRIQSDLARMARLIRSKQQEYVSLDMKDEEASLLQSTVASFAATTANELETLREMITSTGSSTSTTNNIANHRSGIVQILLEQLQQDITIPFGILQKQRTRIAVQIWQNPLQCQLYQPSPHKSKTRADILFDDDDRNPTRNQQFLPRQRQQGRDQLGYDFISKYVNRPDAQVPPNPPDFLVRLTKRQKCGHQSSIIPGTTTRKMTSITPTNPRHGADEKSHATVQFSIPQVQPAAPPPFSPMDYQQQLEEDLQEETAQLSTALIASSGLDSVKQMETRMVEITTLIGQFSNLVQQQQEQVLHVYDTAQETKENMQKGQENLVDATVRTKQFKHYKAWVIFAMAMILLFFHILKN
ncbi:hypothetical protein IV203_018173 [Nitzschia inconspicua]|uniref:t-SNARE coiled-coil homology domain-containing protein n=1 Tax=Nitzschia inconspicua TaxID=303405 RepID=A0A9K3M273_9STRA|nr:hypothetical protein IV203_018173 [Nitzschia inconspicua]